MSYSGWLIYNAGLISKKFTEMNRWYEQAGQSINMEVTSIKNTEVYAFIKENQLFVDGQKNNPDFVLFLDKDIRLADQFERLGIPVFNSKETIDICDNKITMYQILAQHNLPIPNTIFAPMIFPGNVEADAAFLDFIEKELSYPMIVKEAYGSFGAQVYLVENRKELEEKNRDLLHIPHLYQTLIESSVGRDIRIHIVGDKVVASMMRSSIEDFRANVTNGGKMEAVDPSESFKKLAIQASLATGADFSGVDLLFGENGEPIICEVNSNAHIKNIFDCTGVDVTKDILQYIKVQLTKNS